MLLNVFCVRPATLTRRKLRRLGALKISTPHHQPSRESSILEVESFIIIAYYHTNYIIVISGCNLNSSFARTQWASKLQRFRQGVQERYDSDATY